MSSNANQSSDSMSNVVVLMPAVPEHPLVREVGWRSSYFGSLVLRSDRYMRKLSPHVLDLVAELEDSDLYRGVMDLLVATSTGGMGWRMSEFYADAGPDLAGGTSAPQIYAIDQQAMRTAHQLSGIAATVEHMLKKDRSLDRREVDRYELKRAGYSVAKWHRDELPRVEPATPVPEDDPRRLFVLRSGAFLDRTSTLFWTPFEKALALTWDVAVRYAEEEQMDGGGWKLPSQEQLGTLRGVAGVPDEWAWTRETGLELGSAWCGRVATGRARPARKNWRRKVWLAKKLSDAQLRLRMATPHHP